MKVETFPTLGYEIVNTEGGGFSALSELRMQLFLAARKLLGERQHAQSLRPQQWFDEFHHQGITGPELNSLRLELQKKIQPTIGQTLFDAFPRIGELVGLDVVQQRGCNLVIAQPGDPEVAPTHRDAPLNSNFEVVCWVPMNDCRDTKGMTVLTLDQTQQALAILERSSYEEYALYAQEVAPPLRVPFGSACLFWAGLVHTVPVNETTETRWTFNHRYKSYWAPYGRKGSGYFDVLTLSPLTHHGVNAMGSGTESEKVLIT